MTHEELLHTISADFAHNKAIQALYEVVELHKPDEPDFPDEDAICLLCSNEREYVIDYPCPTIQAIEKELAQWDLLK